MWPGGEYPPVMNYSRSVPFLFDRLLAKSRPGDRALAATLAAEAVRHPAGKRILLVGGADHLFAALAGRLMPGDRLTVTSGDQRWLADARERLSSDPELSYAADRVELISVDDDTAHIPSELGSGLNGAGAFDHVVFAAPPGGARSLDGPTGPDVLTAARAAVGHSGTVSFAMPVRPRTDNGAVDDLIGAHAIRSETVGRAAPPMRVHHLRFAAAEPALADRLAPAYSPNRVPLFGRMSIDADGVTVAAGLAAAALVTRAATRRRRWLRHAWLLPAVAAVPAAAFFRDPDRVPPYESEDPEAVVSSADGRVLSIEHISDDRFGSEPWLRIAVFLSVLDVHINRSPVAGRITQIIDTAGGYADARSADAEHNVAKYTVLETARGRVVVAQRSGLIARRIVQRSRPGALLTRGEKFGLIRFGSRTDVYLPADACSPTVAEGDRVTGGETIIARWH